MKRIEIFAIIGLVISVLSVGSSISADCSLNLPMDPVTISVHDGTNSYFVTDIDGAPFGCDVTNGSYPGWCVDRRHVIQQSPIAHEVMLYSSCDPPAELDHERWDMVNYILNHRQGDKNDVQDAIWYFVKMDGVGWWAGHTPSIAAVEMVDNALINGNGFTPEPYQTIAVIAYPLSETQVTVIELHKSHHPKQFTASGAFDAFARPEILSDGLRSVVSGLHSGPRIWWEVTYYFENSEEYLGDEFGGEGHCFLLWDKWGGNLMVLPSPPETFDSGTDNVTLKNDDSFIIDPRVSSGGYKDYIGGGVPLTDLSGGNAWITLHTGGQQDCTNPGNGRGTQKDGRSYDADLRWEIGWLNPGEARELIVYVAPGKNPGGKLQFSSGGYYYLNTGPRVRAYNDSAYANFLYAIEKTVHLCARVEEAATTQFINNTFLFQVATCRNHTDLAIARGVLFNPYDDLYPRVT